MKKIASLAAFLMWAFCLAKPLFSAESEPVEAVVLKVTGTATATVPGQAAPVVVSVGLKLPKGTVIKTDAGAEVHVQPFIGSVATIKTNSTVAIEELSQSTAGGAVTKQKTLLGLRSGNLVSTIDPAKKQVTDYGVRTPKGVAAARGTSYSVSVQGESTTIAATADTVTFSLTGGASYSIQAGLVVVTLANGETQPPVPLATVVATNPEVAQVLSDAVATLSDVVQNNLGGLSAESATNLAAQLVAVASAALPDQAASFTNELVTAIAASGASTGTTSATTATAVAAVTAAAVKAAPGQAAAIATSAVTAAPEHSAIATAAATQAAPSAATTIVQAVAQVTNQTTTQVQAAVNQAATAAAAAVAISNAATQNVVAPPSTTGNTGAGQNGNTGSQSNDQSTISNQT